MERPTTAGGGELRSIVTQVGDTRTKCNDTLNLLSTVAGYYDNLNDCDVGLGEEHVDSLKSIAKKLMAVRQSSDNRSAAFQYAIEQLEGAQVNSPDDLTRAFRNKFDELQKEGKNAVDERTDGPYRTFMAAINKLAQEAEEGESSSTTGDDDDNLVVKMTHSRKDPISQANIRDPVKNRICAHAYDRDSIHEFIKQQKQLNRLARCPHAGCPNKEPLRMEDIVPFPEFFSIV
uniref:E3 SUMO-protein ligase NSE2 n=1 Tax=Plectus sambesii TaxID=2011161 RepID=A0A914WV39_9BILA